MEEQRSNAGQGLGIAGLVLGIVAIITGVIPCTFFLGILLGIMGIVLSIVALIQANRGFGRKGIIVAALACSLIGFVVASVWGFVISNSDVHRIIKEVIHEKGFGNGDRFGDMDWDADTTRGFGEDTTSWSDQPSDMKDMTDSLKNLENDEQ